MKEIPAMFSHNTTFFFIQIDKALKFSDKPLDSSDFHDLRKAIENLAKSKSEIREIETLKRELVDYEEDLNDLKQLKVS